MQAIEFSAARRSQNEIDFGAHARRGPEWVCRPDQRRIFFEEFSPCDARIDATTTR
jgi:hypothetical protein